MRLPGFVRRYPALMGLALAIAVAAVFTAALAGMEWGFARPALEGAPPEWWAKERAGALRMIAAVWAVSAPGGAWLGWRAGRITRWRRAKLLALTGLGYGVAVLSGVLALTPQLLDGSREALLALLVAVVAGALGYGLFFGPLLLAATLLLEWLTRPGAAQRTEVR